MDNILELTREYVKKTKDDWNYITPVDYYKNFYGKKNHILVDLRKPEEFKKFHIKGALNIFWLDLLEPKNLRKLPKDKKIFLICYVGHTSSQAMTLLKLLGYKVTSIKFGYGISPVIGVPVAGWNNYRFPIV